ncbi:hypothetical protein So717_26750 [Roseobacter cerasinus]|uniref:Uncharacterized protein n=1 Tax=Roseobacter cerasinus TaxID=2602289 RepID=A0A640VTE4_9RHOB|nr:hypothetical protein [Roseobacter cerasinus]GFE50922.1 hypothetical protein So717_26750 [Roseobacter cerasinus]
MNTLGLISAKRPHLWELAYFALDLGYAHYATYLPDHADQVHTLARRIIDTSGHSDDPSRLAAVLAALPAQDASFVTSWINTSYFAEDRLTSSRCLAQGAIGRGWVDALGFASAEDAQAALGRTVLQAFDDLAHAQNTLFLRLDDAAIALRDKPVSSGDQQLLSAYPGLGTVADTLTYLTDYILGETLWQALTDIAPDPAVLEILDHRMNTRLALGGRGMAQVNWAEVIA